MTVDALEMDLTRRHGLLKERDLSRSLSNARAREGQQPLEIVRYNLPAARSARSCASAAAIPTRSSRSDFPIKFARDLVVARAAGQAPRPGPRRQAVHQRDAHAPSSPRSRAELQQLGVDWSDAPADVAQLAAPAPPPDVEVKVETDRAEQRGHRRRADEPQGHRHEQGHAPALPPRAVTKSDNPLFDNKELVFGKLEPGQDARRRPSPLGWCEVEGHKVGSHRAAPEGRAARLQDPADALTRSRRHQACTSTRRAAARRPTPRLRVARARRSSARSSRTATRSPTTATATATGASRRASSSRCT